MSPTIKTLVMLVVAAAMAAYASSTYPWPETVVQSEQVGKPLFEDFEAGKVRKLKIVRFNDDKSQLEPIEIRLKAETWVLPAFKNFPVSNNNQKDVAINSLVEKEVLFEQTDEQEKHREFGVVDPGLYQTIPDRSALGTKVIFEDGTGNVLANLIVGKIVKNSKPNEIGEVQHYVTIPGQPAVYIIDLNPRAFTTDFQNWINPNLLSVFREQVVLDVEATSVQINPDDFGKKDPAKLYRVYLEGSTTDKLSLKSIEVGNKEGKFQNAELTTAFDQNWKTLGENLRFIFFGDIRKKAKDLAAAFRKPTADMGPETYAALTNFGFFFKQMKNGTPQFETSNGQIRLQYVNGIRVRMLMGAVSTETARDQDDLNRYVMFTGEYDDSLLPPPPEKPVEGANDAEQRDYLAKVKQRGELVTAAKAFADSFNDTHADWVYLVSDSLCNKLLPEIDTTEVVLIEDQKTQADNEKTTAPKQDDGNSDAAEKTEDGNNGN